MTTAETKDDTEQLLSDLAHGSDEPSAETTRVVTAFLTFQLPDGHWETTSDLTKPFTMERPACRDDFISGAACVHKDVAVIETAHQVIGLLNRAAAQQLQQMARQAAQPETSLP